MLDEKIVDEIHFGATDNFCGSAEVDVEYPWLFSTPGRKSYFHTVKSAKSAADHIKGFEASGNAQFLDRFNGITIFEAYILVQHPELWQFVEHLRKTASKTS
jgi:hypothetical protein